MSANPPAERHLTASTGGWQSPGQPADVLINLGA